MGQGAHWPSHAGRPCKCGSGSPSGAREDGLNLTLARVLRLTSTYGSMPRQGPRRRRPPSARDPRRRDRIFYTFLSSAQRTVLLRRPLSTALVMLCLHLFDLPPLGLVTVSVTERTLRVHSLGALHSVPGLAIRFFMGRGCLVSGAGVFTVVL